MNEIGKNERAEKAAQQLQTEFKEVFTAGDYRIILGHQDYIRLRKVLTNQISLLDHIEATRQVAELQKKGNLPPGASWDERADPVLEQAIDDLTSYLSSTDAKSDNR